MPRLIDSLHRHVWLYNGGVPYLKWGVGTLHLTAANLYSCGPVPRYNLPGPRSVTACQRGTAVMSLTPSRCELDKPYRGEP